MAAPHGTITQPASSVTVQAGQPLTFAGTVVDPSGSAPTVVWDFGDGTTSTILSPGSHVYATPGVYTVTFTAKSSTGVPDPNPPACTVTVQATAANRAPVSAITLPANNLTIPAGQSVTFTGTASDPDGDAVNVLWTFGDGSTSPLLAPGAHTYTTAGSYTVMLTATDSKGMVELNPPTRAITVTPIATNQPPVGVITAPAANTTIVAGQSVSFTGTASDANVDPVTVLWNFGDGSTSTLLSPGAHTYAGAGTFTVSLTATDALGLADPNPPTRTITVTPVATNQPPLGVITAPAANTTITSGQSVTFSGTTSDPNGDTVTVLWTFGDGTTSTLLSPGAHTYATAGTYTVTLTATDAKGLPASAPPTRTITVNPTAAQATLTQVQASVFISCTGCHGATGPSANMSLTAGKSFSNLVNVPATKIPGIRVVPFSSATSAIVTQVTTNGHHPLSAANLALLKSWIDAGALNN